LLSNSGLYILSTDLEGKFTFFNDKFRRHFGWHPFVAIGKDSLPSIHPNDHEVCTNTVIKCFQNPDQAFQVDLRKPRRQGGWQTNRWSFSAQTNAKGQPESILCIGYDISIKMKIEREHRMLIDNIDDVLVTTDLEGDIHYTSESWENQFSFNQEDAVGMPLSNYCSEQHREAFKALVVGIAEDSTENNTLEHRLISEKNIELWAETKCNIDIEGNRLIFLIRDITDRKQAADRLALTTELLNQTQRMAKIGGWKLDVKTGHTIWTEEVYRIHEVPLNFNHNKESGIKFYHPDDQQNLIEVLDNAVKLNQGFDQTFQFITAKGNHRWVRVTGAPVKTNGEINHIQGLFQDITEQQKALIELKKREEQLASVTTNLPGAALQYKLNPDQSHELLYLSNGAFDLWGIEVNAALRDVNLLWNSILPKYIKGMQRAVESSSRDLSPFSYEWQIRHTDGTIKWVSGNGTPKRLPDGSTLWNTLLVDISPLKLAQQELMQQGVMQEKLMHISSEYINFPIEEMDRRIQESLEEIGRFVNADRAYIIQYDYKAVTASNTHEWCGLGIEPVIDSLQDIPMEEYQLLIDNHLLGNYFIIPDVPNMEEGPAKTNLEQQGIKSLITVPMMYGNYCYGCVGFDSVKSVHQYTERELKLLELFSEILVNTITRAATDKKLQVSQEKLKKLTENVPGALYQMEISPEGEVSFPFISEGINELHSDLSPEVLKNDPSAGFKVIHPEDLPEINEKIEISAANLSPFFADYRAIQPDGKIHWNRAISKPERLDDGTTVWYGIFQDITEQRKLEEVQKYAQELKVKNKELEQFTFVASHDLQE
ncbi:MAG: PAS domain S-box protein, partial [Mameliella sp.]|nr:PAS domain S-box protein [Phaeodactylibacter sp.]